MHGNERREQIIARLRNTDNPISGTRLAELLKVSRQVIVQDIALLKATGYEVVSTSRGYSLALPQRHSKVFHVKHQDDQLEAELNAIVDCGGRVEDVFVKHHSYGVLKAPLDVGSRIQVKEFLAQLKSGTSTPLSHMTQGEHYHTVTADSPKVFDYIEEELLALGILAECV